MIPGAHTETGAQGLGPLDPRYPERYPRRVLLLVTGLSPQVVTETLYALAVAAPRPFVPTEIRIVTTAEGARFARLMLLDAREGRFHALCREYDLPPIHFDEESVVVVHSGGRAIEDLTTEEDNRAAADAIVSEVRRLTSDDATAVHASIAGGRKTMGFYLGYAMSLFGRPQDRLSHVLVSAPFEADHQFYYPPREARTLVIGGRPVSTAEARIMLADIPFVRLRHGLDRRLLEGAVSYAEAVEEAARAFGPVDVIIDLDHRELAVSGVRFRLPPAELAFYSFLARRKVRGKGPVACPPDGCPDEELAEDYLAEYEETAGARVEGARARLRGGMEARYFSERKAKLQRCLRERLGPEGASAVGVRAVGRGAGRRFEVAVEPGRIRWAGE